MAYRDYDRGYRGSAGERDFDRDYDRDYERGQERGAYGREGGFREGGYGAREGWRGEAERGGMGRGERDWYGSEPYRGGGGYGGSSESWRSGGGYGGGGYAAGGYGGGSYGGGSYGGGAYRGGAYRGGSYGGEPYDASSYGYGPSYGRYGARSYGGAGGFERDEYGYAARDRESWMGRHAGRGPKGYRRSDDRIREDVNDRLTAHPDIDASEIEVRVQNGEVTLSGVVEDRRTKRMAEDAIEEIAGVDDVHNQLKVRHGFLAGLTGEKADEREVSRAAVREGTQRSTSTTSTTGAASTTGATGTSTTTGAGTGTRG